MTAIAIVRRPISILAKARGYFADLTLGFDELIGPLSSIFWLAGLDELVDAINDPTIALQDEVRGVQWILEHLFEEEKLPASLYDELEYSRGVKSSAKSWTKTIRKIAVFS